MKYTGKLGKMLLTSVGLSHNMWMMYCEIKWDLWLFFLILKKSYANWCCVMLWVSACCISYAASPGITWWYPVIFGWILRQAVKRINLKFLPPKHGLKCRKISAKYHQNFTYQRGSTRYSTLIISWQNFLRFFWNIANISVIIGIFIDIVGDFLIFRWVVNTVRWNKGIRTWT